MANPGKNTNHHCPDNIYAIPSLIITPHSGVGGRTPRPMKLKPAAFKIAQQAVEQNKILGAICIAPSILANAGVLKNKKATVYPSESSNLKTKGAIYTTEDVTRDGNIITANGPAAAQDFAETITQALLELIKKDNHLLFLADRFNQLENFFYGLRRHRYGLIE